MDTTVNVTIPAETTVAAELRDDRTRSAVRRLVSRILRRQRREMLDRLFTTMERLGAEAEARVLTDEILDAELDAYNAERRG
jgi:hypothetical protein